MTMDIVIIQAMSTNSTPSIYMYYIIVTILQEYNFLLNRLRPTSWFSCRVRLSYFENENETFDI